MNKKEKFESALENMLDTKPIKNVNKTLKKDYKKENKTQKIMKKTKLIFIGILLSLITISCSSDSHEVEEETPTITLTGAKWYLFDYYWEKNRECETKSFIQFNNDGTFRRVDYFYIPEEGGCYLEHDDTGTYTYDAVNKKIQTYYYRGEIKGKLSTDIYANVKLTSSTFYSDYDEGADGKIDDLNVGYKK